MKIQYANVERPMPSQQFCGDIGFLRELNENLFLALVDVAGHGERAAELAEQCYQFFERHHELLLLEMMTQLHEEFHGSRGFAVSLCRLNSRTGSLEFVGTGNITTRIFGPHQQRLIPRDGVVGFRMPEPKNQSVQLSSGDTLVLYSDGVKEHFEITDYLEIGDDPVETVANNIIHYFGKETDDASCIVVRLLDD